jgi:AraC-like DNA-binding protein
MLGGGIDGGAARDMIVYDRARVGDAARRVGYESVSQFSREYHRHFDVAPATARHMTGGI